MKKNKTIKKNKKSNHDFGFTITYPEMFADTLNKYPREILQGFFTHRIAEIITDTIISESPLVLEAKYGSLLSKCKEVPYYKTHLGIILKEFLKKYQRKYSNSKRERITIRTPKFFTNEVKALISSLIDSGKITKKEAAIATRHIAGQIEKDDLSTQNKGASK
ncbi:MAG: hypothetical protein EOM23_00330 [Candidatus Moranbacteria bacterium]|nr:hypothetical protein [Candidatus Moranbacteria bacterium]